MARKAIVVIGIIVGLMLIPAGTALAASPQSSCVGHESSAISPKGTSDEFPGGRPQLNEFIRETFPGTPPGQIVAFIAHIHAGSHEACE